ncbi:unnamed protein product [Absidia cylindrospora]
MYNKLSCQSVVFNPTYSGQSLSIGNDNSATFAQNNNLLDRSTHFLTTVANHVELWDVNYPGNTNLHSIEPDESPANVAHWSSLSTSLIVTGGEAGHLYVVDLRLKDHQGIVWKAPEAHSNAIRDAQFNPFIPYWLASGGDDSIVNIWDLRATCHKPLAKIDGHHGPISSIAWGNVRPEKLATTSRDGTFRIWSLSGSTIPIWDSYYQMVDSGSHRKTELLQLEEKWWPGTVETKIHSMDENFGICDGDIIPPEDSKVVPVGAFGIGEWGKLQIGPLYYGDLHKHSKGPVIQVLVSKNRPGLFYCATRSGQLCSQIFRPTTRGALDYPHRYDCDKDPLCYTIDNAIHYRHINLANNLIENLKAMDVVDDEQKRIRDDRVKDFEDCLNLRPPIQENDWNFDCFPAQDGKRLWTDTDMWQCALDIFRKDLAYWRTHLAPGCETIFADIPLDTGNLHPRLSSQLMKGTGFKLDKSNLIFPWDQAPSAPSPSPSFYDSSARKSQPDVEASPKVQTNKGLRRSSTTPNLTNDDFFASFAGLESLNERNSSGTVLNTGANWTPLQRAQTTAVPRQPKQLSRQPSFSPSTIKSIFTKSSKRLEKPLKQQNKSSARQESPLSQKEGPTVGQELQQKQQGESSSRQKTPVSLYDETLSGQETPLSQQDKPVIRQESSSSKQPTTLPTQNEHQQQQNTNPFDQQDTSPSLKDKSPAQRTNKHQSRQQRNISPVEREKQPPPSQQNISPTQRVEQQPQLRQDVSPLQHGEPEKFRLDTSGDDQHIDNAANSIVSSPQEMDIKSIIKFGSFGHPAAAQGNNQSIATSASTNNLSTSTNHNPITRATSSETSLPYQTTSTDNRSPLRLSDNNDIPIDSSELGNGKSPPRRNTTNKTDNDTSRPHMPQQHSGILAPAKSLRRAFTKKLQRNKTRSVSSSSISSNNPTDRDPQHHRQQPQADVSRPSSRNAL